MATNEKYHNEIGAAMQPFVMRDLVDTVMKKKALPLQDALYYIYSSRLYKSLLDEEAKLWYSSTLSLYESSKVLLFKMFCIENYKESKGMGAEETLVLFSKYGVFDFLCDNFEMLHTQDTDYILDTITTYINKKV